MKILDAIEYQNQTRQILSEGYQDLTESQKIYLNRWEKELWPLLEEYNRLAEATLTTDQIQDIFKGAEQQSIAGGQNKTMLGKVGGAVGAAAKLPVDIAKAVDKKLGITSEINFDIEEVGKPIRFNWGKCPLATASFGHGITTTLLQLAKAYSIIVNGGYNIQPRLIKKYKKNKKEKILNDEVSQKILPILRKIVTSKEGTASFDVTIFLKIGKTF